MEEGKKVKLTYVASGGCCGQVGIKEIVVCAKFGRLGEVHGHLKVIAPCIW